jgi:hypothetical protein
MARIGVLVENINNPSERSSVLSAMQAIFVPYVYSKHVELHNPCGETMTVFWELLWFRQAYDNVDRAEMPDRFAIFDIKTSYQPHCRR